MNHKTLTKEKKTNGWLGEITLRSTIPDTRPQSVIDRMSDKEKQVIKLTWLLFGK